MWHIKLVKGKSLVNFKLNAIFSGEHALEEPCCYRNKSVSGRGLAWRDKRSIVCENNLCLDSGIFPDLTFSCLPLSYNKYCNEPRGKESGDELIEARHCHSCCVSTDRGFRCERGDRGWLYLIAHKQKECVHKGKRGNYLQETCQHRGLCWPKWFRLL